MNNYVYIYIYIFFIHLMCYTRKWYICKNKYDIYIIIYIHIIYSKYMNVFYIILYIYSFHFYENIIRI